MMWLLFEFYLSTDIDNIKTPLTNGKIPIAHMQHSTPNIVQLHMWTENAAAFEKNIAFFCPARYNRYIPEKKGACSCQDRHDAVGFVAHHKSIHSVPTDVGIVSRSC